MQHWRDTKRDGSLARNVDPSCFSSAIVCLWLDFGLPPQCPQVKGPEFEPLSSSLTQDGSAECDQREKS